MADFKLSVVVPNYNNEKYIRQCIESIEEQTYEIEAIIIVDDCSTDSSRTILTELQNKYPNIVIEFLPSNKGVSNARNIGISLCKSEYITFLDADDICADSHKFENEMKLIKQYCEKGIDIAAYSHVVYIDECGKRLKSAEKNKVLNGEIYEHILCTYNTAILPRDYCVKTEIIRSAGCFREEMNLFEDYELLLKVAKKYPFYCTEKAGTAYRLKDSGLSSRSVKDCDTVFMSIFWEKIECEKKIKKIKCVLMKYLSYADRRYIPIIMRYLRFCKKVLKKTMLYRLKENLRQNRKIILFRLIITNYLFERKKTIGRKVISLKEYSSEEYKVIEEECERPVYLAPYFEQTAGEIKTVKTPEIYLASIENAGIVGGCGALFTKKYCILDILANDKENRVDYVSMPTCFYEHKKLYVKYRKKNKPIYKAISLCGAAPFNYYHFMIELMSRLEYVEKYVEDKTIPILVDEAAFSYSQMEELFACINRYRRPIIKVRNDTLYKVKELIYPSMNTWFPVNVQIGLINRYEDFGIAKSALTNLRSTILDSSATVRTRKLYISRKKKKLSRLVNEADVENLFISYGFEVIYPEELSFSQQVQVFREAQQVAGVSGAAFANIVFCAPDTKVICIIPKEYNFYLYSSMAYLLDEQFIFLNAELANKGENAALSQFRLDLSYCEKFLMDLNI